MHNLVEKFTPDSVDTNEDDGVVAIEYVLVAALVAAGVGLVFAKTGIWTALAGKLNGVLTTP